MKYIIHKGQHAIVAEAGNCEQLVPHIEGAVLLGKNHLAAPYSVTATQQLNKMGFDIVSPMIMDYDWPMVVADGKHWPAMPHQKATAAFLTLNRRAYCLNQIGTQKTASCLFAVDYLISTKTIRKVLVASPLSTLEQVWGDTTYFTFGQRLSGAVLHGTAARRKKLFAQEHDIYIINHDALNIITDRKYYTKKIYGDKMNPNLVTAEVEKLISATLLRDDIDLIIVDEGAEFRNSNTDKYSILDKLVRPEHWLWWLTGTPRPRAATDVWAQCKIVTPQTVPDYFTMFRQMTMKQINQFRWEDRPEANEIIKQVMQPSILFERSVLNLEEPVYSGRSCELTKEQKKHYTELMNDFVTEVASGAKISAINAGVKQSKLMQIACGVVYDSEGNEITIKATPRLNTLRELIMQAGHKVIVFVPFTHVLNDVAEAVSKDWNVEVVNGKVSKTQRDIIFNKFQNTDDPHVLVADARTMAHGLTLTKAATIAWYAPAPSNNIYTQANGRITRSGQTVTPNIVHISATPLERRIYKRHQNETSEQGALIELIKETMSSS